MAYKHYKFGYAQSTMAQMDEYGKFTKIELPTPSEQAPVSEGGFQK